MRQVRSSRRLHLASLAVGAAALFAFSVGGVAENQAQQLSSADGAGTFRLTLTQGGSLSGEVRGGQGDDRSAYVIQAALVDFAQDEENPGMVRGEIDGYLRDSQSHELAGRFEGVFAMQGGNGRFLAEVHPLDGPDPHKVDAGSLRGWMRVNGVIPEGYLPIVQLHGPVLLELELNQEL